MEKIHASTMITVSLTVMLFTGIFLYAFLFNPDIGYTITGLVVVSPDVPFDEEILAVIAEKGEARVILELKAPIKGSGFSAKRDVSLASIPSHIKSQQAKALEKTDRFITRHKFNSLNAVSGVVDELSLEELRKNPEIERIHLDLEITTFLGDSIPLISASHARNISFNGTILDGSGKTVCVIDTGIDYTHEALGNCTEQEFLAGNCKKVLGGIDYVNDNDNPMDDNGHGTHVAGIIASNGSVKGVAPGAALVAVKALNSEGSGWISDAMKGVEWCTEHRDEFNISVISMSLGSSITYGSFCDSNYQSGALTIDNAVSAGLSVVSATGNSGNAERIAFPSCAESSLRVASSTKNDAISSFSNRGPGFPDIFLAPGSNIYSTLPGNNHGFESGTSMATPHVSGAIVLLEQFEEFQGNSFNQSKAKSFLLNNSIPIFDSESNMSLARVDVFKALMDLDVTPPFVYLNITSPSLDGNISVSWMAYDNVQLNHSNVKLFHPNNTLMLNSSNATGNLSFHNLTGLGTYNASLFAEDHKGLQSESFSSFTIKETPVVELLLNGYEENISFPGEGLVNITGLSYNNTFLELFLDNQSLGEGINVSVNHSFSVPGYYNVTLVSVEDSSFYETSKQLSVLVINATPVIKSVSPDNFSLQVFENETIVFSHNSTNPLNGALNSSWLVNNSLESNGSDFLFNVSEYELSSYNITLVVSNNYSSSNISWLVSIAPVPPVISFYEPENTSVVIRKNDSLLFSHSSFDVFNRSLNVSWLVNNSFVSGNDSFLFNSTNYDISSYNVSLVVSNNLSSSSTYWSLEVLPPRIPVTFNESKTIPGLSWEQGSSLQSALNLSEYFSFEGGTKFELRNSSSVEMSVSEGVASFTSPSSFHGSEKVYIFAFDEESNASSNSFHVNVSEKEEEPSAPASGGGGGAPSPSPPAPSPPPPESEEELVVESEILVSPGFNASVEDNILRVENTEEGFVVERITVRSDSAPGKASVSVSEVLPEDLPVSPGLTGRAVYKAFSANMSLENASSEEITFSFKVAREWVSQQNVSASDVVLLRYNDGWVELETSLERQDDSHYYFEAISPGLSYFAISTRETIPLVEEIPGVVNETEEPVVSKRDEFLVNLLSAIATVFALLILFVLFDKYAKKQALKEKKKLDEEKKKKNTARKGE